MRIKNFSKFNEEFIDDSQFGFFSEIERGSMVRANKRIISDSYNDYISAKNKESMARKIRGYAESHIKNSEGKLEDWLEKFKDEKIVLDELNKIKILNEEVDKMKHGEIEGFTSSALNRVKNKINDLIDEVDAIKKEVKELKGK